MAITTLGHTALVTLLLCLSTARGEVGTEQHSHRQISKKGSEFLFWRYLRRVGAASAGQEWRDSTGNAAYPKLPARGAALPGPDPDR